MQVISLKMQHSKIREAQFRWRLIVVTVLVNVLGYALVACVLTQSRQHYQERAETSAQNIARLLKQNVADTLDIIETNLLATKLEIERQQASGGINDAALNTFMQRLHTRLPEMGSIWIVNANGVITQNSGKTLASEAGVDSQEYFQFLRDHPLAGLYVSKPLLERTSGDWILILSRRVNHPDGSFAGVLNGTVSLSHFQQLFSSPEIGAQGLVSLRNEELGLITRHPKLLEAEGVPSNNRLPEGQELLLDARHDSLIIAPSPVDGVMRTTAVHKVGNFPLYVTVGLAHDDYFEEWWRAVSTASESLLLFTLMTALLSLLLYHTRLDRMLVVAYKCSKRSRPCRLTGFGNRMGISASSRFQSMLQRSIEAIPEISPAGCAEGAAST